MSDTPVVEIEQPQVTEATKFRRGGFKPAAEVIAEAETAAPAATDPETDSVMNEIIAADETVGIEYGEGVAASPPEVTEPEEEEPPAPGEAAPEAKFKILGREFATQAEAWAYAEQLERERDTADAFRQGVEAAAKLTPSNPASQTQRPAEPQEIDPLYYTDPQAYFTKREAEIIAKATETVEQKSRQKQTHETTWNQFYADYPDLAQAKEFVDLTLQQNWNTLQHVETKQALKQLADKTRAKLKPILDAAMPKVTLPKVKTAASPGGAEQVTRQERPKQALNFAQQLKNLKKSRAQLR